MKKKKISEKQIKRIFIIISVIIGIIVIDNIRFSVDIQKAERYYENKKFSDAIDIIEKYPLHKNNELVKKLNYSKYLFTYYNMASFSWNKDDEKLNDLFSGYAHCLNEKPKNDWEKKIVNEIKGYYYSAINKIVDLDEQEIISISSLEYTERKEKVKDIMNGVYETETKNNNPSVIKITSCNSRGASGTIYNQGNKTIKYVKLKISFRDSSNSVIDTDWTYAVGSEGLAPNESKKWNVYVDKDYNISKCSYSIID